MNTERANVEQIRCIKKLAKKNGIPEEVAAMLWCDKCAKHWREMQHDEVCDQQDD
jgi:hypothetical protein